MTARETTHVIIAAIMIIFISANGSISLYKERDCGAIAKGLNAKTSLFLFYCNIFPRETAS